MALGRPAVLTPKALDIRAVQGSVNAIRERLQFIEQAIALATAQANSSSAKGDITALQAQLAQLTARVTAIELVTGAAEEDTVDLVAAADIAAGDPVVMEGTGPDSCVPLDPTDPVAIYAVVGLAQTAAIAGQTVSVLRRGNFTINTGVTFDVGRAVYANTTGLTQYPSYVDLAIPIGVATGEESLWVAPGWPALRALGFESGYEDFLPATVGLVRDAVLLTDDFNAATNGIAVKTGENDVTTRTLTGTAARVSVANGSGVVGNPTVDIDVTYVGQPSITTVGTIATGTWEGTTIAADHGGTGVANAVGSTITLGGALTTSGAFASTFTMTGTTTVTFPTSGTLATTSQLPAGANPTASVGLAAVNGVATTFMRSDGAPVLSQAILPTWTGVHKWNLNATALTSFTPTPTLQIAQADAAATSILLDSYGAGNAYIGRRAQGTAAAKSAVQSGQGLGGFQALGYGATAYATQVTGVILMAATENWTDTAWGTELQIFTTKTGTTTRTVTFKVNDAVVALTTDNQELQVGAGADLRLYHDGTDSIVRNDTGNLLFKAGATTYYTLTSAGASTFAGVVTGNSFVPSSSTVPTDGMYLPAANNLGWSVSSAVAMRLNATGLGVGRTPAQKLDVEGTAAAGQVVGRIGNTSTSNGSAAVLCLDPSNNGFGVRDGQIRATNNGSNAITVSVWTANGAAPTEKLQVTPAGQLALQVAGQGISIKEGSNAKQGTATLVAGTVTVNNTSVTANSRIFLTIQSLGTVAVPKAIAVTAKTAATSFVITSSDATDTSVVAYEIFEPS